jgi:hypothetical protein
MLDVLFALVLLYLSLAAWPAPPSASVRSWAGRAADLLCARRTRRRAAQRAADLAPYPSPLYQFCTLLT